jgi:Biotin-requiring enzyme
MSDDRVTITSPLLGENVVEATISRWLLAPGDTVDARRPRLEVASDKTRWTPRFPPRIPGRWWSLDVALAPAVLPAGGAAMRDLPEFC